MLIRAILALALLLIAPSANAEPWCCQSYRPSPSAGEESKPVEEKHPENDANTAKNQRGSEERPFVVKSYTAPRNQAEAEQDADYRQRQATEENVIKLAIWTLGAAVLQTLVLAGTLSVSLFVAIRQLRAYVLPQFISIAGIEGAPHPHARVVIKNFGQTPAHKLTHWAGMDIREYPLKGEFEYLLPPALPAHVVAPDDVRQKYIDEMPKGPQRPVSAQELAALKDKSKAFYVFGEIKYQDVFWCWHVTKYRYMTGGPVGLRGEATVTCEEGNSAT